MEKVFFSPGNHCRDAIIDQLNHAVSSVKICVFTISDDLISSAILHRHRFGIPVRIITDNDKCYDAGSDIEKLCKAGIEVKVDKSPYHMHHKFAVIDNRMVLTGSYNWTLSAAMHNHENLLISSDKEVVKRFGEEFERLWKLLLDY